MFNVAPLVLGSIDLLFKKLLVGRVQLLRPVHLELIGLWQDEVDHDPQVMLGKQLVLVVPLQAGQTKVDYCYKFWFRLQLLLQIQQFLSTF